MFGLHYSLSYNVCNFFTKLKVFSLKQSNRPVNFSRALFANINTVTNDAAPGMQEITLLADFVVELSH